MSDSTGVVFPEVDGARSTSALGRAVVADALRPVDPVGARAAEQETSWRHGYLTHFRRLVEAGLLSADGERSIAAEGLASLHRRMRVRLESGDEVGLAEVFTQPAAARTAPGSATGSASDGGQLGTEVIEGRGEPARELSLPYRGERLRGDALLRRLDVWTQAGVLEPSAAEAVRQVAAHPEWLDLSDQRLVVLGAGSEMGPLRAVLSWGGDVVGVDLPRPEVWNRLAELTSRSAGRLRVPAPLTSDARPLEQRAGADLLHRLPQVADWLEGIDGRLVLGNYVYADGATNVRVAMAVDALSVELQRRRDDVALAFLATPTDVFAVPGDAVSQSGRAYESPGLARVARQPLRMLSGGRLLRRNYAPGADPGANDSLVPQQGPNYALAKRLQRWRAVTARQAGTTVSMKVAPPTRTRSVVKNRALAAAYAGAHRFGIAVFEPATSNVLMAALLVHDLRVGTPAHEHPWQDEAFGAVHGGLWRGPYDPRSALGLAVVLGLGGARG